MKSIDTKYFNADGYYHHFRVELIHTQKDFSKYKNVFGVDFNYNDYDAVYIFFKDEEPYCLLRVLNNNPNDILFKDNTKHENIYISDYMLINIWFLEKIHNIPFHKSDLSIEQLFIQLMYKSAASVMFCYDIGLLLYQNQRYKEVLPFWNYVVTHYDILDSYTELYVMLAYCHEYDSNLSMALKYYKQALETKDVHHVTLLNYIELTLIQENILLSEKECEYFKRYTKIDEFNIYYKMLQAIYNSSQNNTRFDTKQWSKKYQKTSLSITSWYFKNILLWASKQNNSIQTILLVSEFDNIINSKK